MDGVRNKLVPFLNPGAPGPSEAHGTLPGFYDSEGRRQINKIPHRNYDRLITKAPIGWL